MAVLSAMLDGMTGDGCLLPPFDKGGGRRPGGFSAGSAERQLGIDAERRRMENSLSSCRNRWDSGSGFWTAEAGLRAVNLRNPGSALQSGAIAPRNYRRVADDDPPVTAGRRIEVSFRQPPMPDYVDTANLNYVIAIPGEIFPDVIEHFSYNAHRGEAVIDEAIVEDDAQKLRFDNTRYNLEAYSKIGNELENPPEGTEKFEFTIIVDSIPPETE